MVQLRLLPLNKISPCVRIKYCLQTKFKTQGDKVMNDTNSLAHTTWNCKYHIVFAPKYRRLVFFGQKRKEIGAILRQLCEWKNVEIVEAEVCPDHIHMLVRIPPKESVSGFIGFLKGKSSLLIYQKYANMKFKYRDRTFWCRGYYVDTVGKNTEKIKEYIANQLKEDKLTEQMTITEVIDPLKTSGSLRERQTMSKRLRYASNKGFYPKLKNPQFNWGIFIFSDGGY